MLRKMIMVLSLLLPVTAAAQGARDPAVSDTLKHNIRIVQHLALNPLLVRAVRQQNGEELSMETIRQREQQWTGQASNLDGESGHAVVIRRFLETHDDFNKLILVDKRGANVAASENVKDYWQGDDDVWARAYNGGDGQVFVSPMERDRSSGDYIARVSAPVLDRSRTIGVLVVGVRLNGGR